jgi:hypothetical protein
MAISTGKREVRRMPRMKIRSGGVKWMEFKESKRKAPERFVK